MARRIKAHPAYTATLGNLLGIIGPDDGIDLSGRQPDISADDPALSESRFRVAHS